jgi:hypothetical protein
MGLRRKIVIVSKPVKGRQCLSLFPFQLLFLIIPCISCCFLGRNCGVANGLHRLQVQIAMRGMLRGNMQSDLDVLCFRLC